MLIESCFGCWALRVHKNSFVVGDKYIVHYENSFDIIRGGVVVDVKE